MDDPTVTEGDQVVDDEPGAEPFVVDDGVEVLRRTVQRDRHDRQPLADLLDRCGVQPRRHQDQAVDLTVDETLDTGLLALRGGTTGNDDDLERRGFQLVGNRLGDLELEGCTELRDDDADGV